MPIPHLKHQGVKLAPFKTTGVSPFGAFENTTPPGKYPIAQTKNIDGQPRQFNWPSSEHAYHAQKIIALKEKLPANHPEEVSLLMTIML